MVDKQQQHTGRIAQSGGKVGGGGEGGDNEGEVRSRWERGEGKTSKTWADGQSTPLIFAFI